ERRAIAVEDASDAHAVQRFAGEPRPARVLSAFVAAEIQDGRRVVLIAPEPGLLDRLVRAVRSALPARPETAVRWADVVSAPPGAVLAMQAALGAGFRDLAAEVTAITAADLFGSAAAGPSRAGHEVEAFLTDSTLHVGDVVVHRD